MPTAILPMQRDMAILHYEPSQNRSLTLRRAGEVFLQARVPELMQRPHLPLRMMEIEDPSTRQPRVCGRPPSGGAPITSLCDCPCPGHLLRPPIHHGAKRPL